MELRVHCVTIGGGMSRAMMRTDSPTSDKHIRGRIHRQHSLQAESI